MNAKQERFIQEFLLDLNATQAAVRTGYSRKTAAEQAFALLRKPQIRKAIDEATDERAARTQADQDAVIRRLVAVAFADLGDFSQWDAEGNLTITPFEELDPEKRQAIKDVTTSVTTRQGRSGEIVVSAKTTLRLHDSLKVHGSK
jgi:phage terminase small subunit